ncbi:thioesterase superfamily protein [Pyronema omphalodes]|nr:thioesterase superfamily protein [Pyronema omphalodes]
MTHPRADLSHPDFSAPWIQTLLSTPSTKILTHTARIAKTNGEDTLFSTTLHSATTIRAYLLLQTPTETLQLVSLGEQLTGHAGIAHGGVVVTLLDEALGAAVGEPCFTAWLNTQFRRPVRTPGVVVVRARCMKREGRKFWAEAKMEDGEGMVLATAEALFVLVKEGAKL